MRSCCLTTSPLARQPVGTGPYRLVEWKAGEKIVLEAYDGYWEGRPNIDRYLYRIIPDSATMFLELSAGNLDEMGLDPVQYTRQTDTEFFTKSYRKSRYLADSYSYLGFNLKLPLFQDKRVRQAISHAVNKQEIIDIVLLGLGQEPTGPYKPGTWGHNPEVKRYPFDLARAQALLAEAGSGRQGIGRRPGPGRQALRVRADDEPRIFENYYISFLRFLEYQNAFI